MQFQKISDCVSKNYTIEIKMILNDKISDLTNS